MLFVAEKRAAIEAVHKRLEEVGLGNLTLDLHGSRLRKKDLAESLSRSLKDVGTATRPNVARLQAEVFEQRGLLVDYEANLHSTHEPWEKSYFEVLEELSGLRAVPYIQLPDAVTDGMDDESQLRAESLFAELRSTERSIDTASPWNAVSFVDEADAVGQIDQVGAIREQILPDLFTASAAAESSVPGLADLTISQTSMFLGLHAELVDLEKRFSPALWDLDLLATHTALAAKRPFLPSSSEYRSSKKAITSMTGSRFRRGDVVADLERAMEVDRQWQQMLGERPERVPVAPELERTHQTFLAFAPTLALVDTSLMDRTVLAIQQLVARLSATEQTALLRGQAAEHRAALERIGVGPIIQRIDSGELSEEVAAVVLKRSVLEGAKRRIERDSRILGRFDGTEHTNATRRYAEADRQHIESAVERVSRIVAEEIVRVRNDFVDQNALVEREARKKTRHRSLRQLQDGAGDLLTALKPCWMMSPLMVAQSLPARATFDYVVFDEASQIRPADAISSLLRGRNVVVAGDRRQLPPSAFFDSSSSEDIDDYDEESDSLATGYESLLDVVSVTLPARMLNWHYRSNDDRLIALSNDHIYGGSLTTFPGSQRESPIRFHKVDHIPSDKTEFVTNATEVHRVVELMLDHARSRPEMSLGVIAFGQRHATAIEDRLHQTLVSLGDEELDEYFDENRPERVFVKNIERVQGDERDAIILTIGYGHDLTGKVPLRFGPVNQDGGERRINVAASRARSRMDVVSSIESSELNVGGSSKGPQLLRDLIRFAETAGEDTGAATAQNPLNPFELAVKYELDELGLNPISQYGSSGYRIDFALPHPDNDGRMVLAVEADGASYHSSKTARDRDRLRQQVLEAKGWKFHRIWSTAFFRDPKAEALRVKGAYERALNGDPEAPLSPFEALDKSVPPTTKAAKPYLLPGGSITDYKHRELVALARWVTNNGEKLLTHEQIHDVMKAELGFGRSGVRIREAFDRAIRDAGVAT